MPCLAELPDLVEVGREYAERGGIVVAVSQDLSVGGTRESVVPKVRSVVERIGIDFPVFVYDGELEPLNERFDLPGPIPSTIAIDRDGVVVERADDAIAKDRMVELMEAALR